MRIELIQLEHLINKLLIDYPFAFKNTLTVKWKPLQSNFNHYCHCLKLTKSNKFTLQGSNFVRPIISGEQSISQMNNKSSKAWSVMHHKVPEFTMHKQNLRKYSGCTLSLFGKDVVNKILSYTMLRQVLSFCKLEMFVPYNDNNNKISKLSCVVNILNFNLYGMTLLN